MAEDSVLSHNAARQQADDQQQIAADPGASVFVSASAGSGKTKLLIDRLLRLMMPRFDQGMWHAGTPPEKILCLTYTKAAASEMAIRLQGMLGEWVILDDMSLRKALVNIQVLQADVFHEEEKNILKAARSLFARVLDLPGGMRISTIHAFCQSLLRRFPLEADISPYFTVSEGSEEASLLMRMGEQGVVRFYKNQDSLLFTQVSITRFFSLLRELQQNQHRFERFMHAAFSSASSPIQDATSSFAACLKQLLDISGESEADIFLEALEGLAKNEHLPVLLRGMQEEGSVSEQTKAQTIQNCFDQIPSVLGNPDACAALWKNISSFFINEEGVPKAIIRSNSKLYKNSPHYNDIVKDIIETIQQKEDECKRWQLYRLNAELYAVAFPILASYASFKREKGKLDYNDLIQLTLSLLKDPGSAWVLYKLDGGIDHILLDEVQDTSARQWQIAAALSEEFFSGETAQTERVNNVRTIFAVGDYKQSIYSFQGAQPEQFLRWEKIFEHKVQAVGQVWKKPTLNVSFRSSRPVLKLVDAVLAHLSETRSGQIIAPHISAFPDKGGRVELWPLPKKATTQREILPSPWQAFKTNQELYDNEKQLAESIAVWLQRNIGVSWNGSAPLLPQDVLILVRKRSSFVKTLIRNLKQLNIPVVSALRTSLKDQVAIQDMIALCEVLLLPEDDLALACVLTSPIGNLDDESLMALASPQRADNSLWSHLQARAEERLEWQNAASMLRALFSQVDRVSPHLLLSEILGKWGARARFLSRLGIEAGEALDELLDAALEYEKDHVPSLQGFVFWIKNSESSTRQELDPQGREVRIMTVHGAKGLQSRVVILPDTIQSKSGNRSDAPLLWVNNTDFNEEFPIWVPRKEFMTQKLALHKHKDFRAIREESERLLYVALTRAAERLIICSWKSHEESQKDKDGWYQLCKNAMISLSAHSEECNFSWVEEGEKIYFIEEKPIHRSKTLTEAVPITRDEPFSPLLPTWMGQAPSWQAEAPLEEGFLSRPLTPSRPEGIEFNAFPPAVLSPLARLHSSSNKRGKALQRGIMIHKLLQFIPQFAYSEQMPMIKNWLSQPAHHLSEDEIEKISSQIFRVMATPDLAPLFSDKAIAEQALMAQVQGRLIMGQVDRLCVMEDKVLVCDFKTNLIPPTHVEHTPVYYLRQMAAYRQILSEIYPMHEILCWLVWTEIPRADKLADALLDEQIKYIV